MITFTIDELTVEDMASIADEGSRYGEIVAVDLKDGTLNKQTVDEIVQVFAALPTCVHELLLKIDELCQKSDADLVKIFAAIPVSMKILKLRYASSPEEIVHQLGRILAVVCSGITTLDLGGNYLYKKSSAEISQIFTAIPASISSLNLSCNSFDQKTATELAQIFAAIPKTVTTIGLGCNNFWKKSEQELKTIFASIPNHVTKVKHDLPGRIKVDAFDRDGLFFNFSKKELVRNCVFDLRSKNTIIQKASGFINAVAQNYSNQRNKPNRVYTLHSILSNQLAQFLTPTDAARLALVCKAPEDVISGARPKLNV